MMALTWFKIGGVGLLFGLMAGFGQSNPASSQEVGLSKAFNAEAVSGTIQFAPGGVQIKNYSLSRRDGSEKTFKTCAELMAYLEASTIPSEFIFYRKYQVECYAAEVYAASAPAQKRFYQDAPFEAILDFPATISPRIGEAELFAEREGKTIGAFFGDIEIKRVSDMEVSTVMELATVDYTMMARGDINADGVEDILVEQFYHLIEGAGRGVKLFALTKTSADAPVEILWSF